MGTDLGDPAEVSGPDGATATPPDGARKTWSPHLELASRARALWRDLSWREASGSLGDLGTFLPLLVGLTVESGLDVGTTLIVTGVYNLVTALCFDVPMPVQPMKTIAAVALSDDAVTVPQIVAAGAFVSAAVFFLGATGLIDTFNRLVPRAVVHGMQIGLGTILCVRAFTMAVFDDAGDARALLGADGLLVAAAALALAVFGGARKTFSTRCARSGPGPGPSRCDEDEEQRPDDRSVDERELSTSELSIVSIRSVENGCPATDVENGCPETTTTTRLKNKTSPSTPPTALALVLAGLALSATRPGSLSSLRVGPTTPKPVTFTADDWATGIVKAGLPQLPLTTLNSVVAVCALSKELFPDRPAAPKRVATSVGAMNLAGAAIGVMPCCHGAGGLAAHYHFGARRGAATAFLGLCKLTLGALFGGSLLTLLQAFPKTVLGVMLGAASVELVRAAVGAFLGNRAKGAAAAARRKAASGETGETTTTRISTTTTTTNGLATELTIARALPRDAVSSGGVPEIVTPLWREPDTYTLLATAVATAASGNTGIGVAVGLAAAAATRLAAGGRATAAEPDNALEPTPPRA